MNQTSVFTLVLTKEQKWHFKKLLTKAFRANKTGLEKTQGLGNRYLPKIKIYDSQIKF